MYFGRVLAGAVVLSTASILAPATVAHEAGAPEFVRVIGRPAPTGYLNNPLGVAVSRAEDSRIYVVDGDNARIHVFTAQGQPIDAFGKRGDSLHQFWNPSDVAVSRDGRYVYVVDPNQAVVQRFEVDTRCTVDPSRLCLTGNAWSWGGRGIGAGLFLAPKGVAVDVGGNVYVTDAEANVIQVFDDRGVFIRAFGHVGPGIGELNHPTSIAVTDDGIVMVADRDNDRVTMFTTKGEAYTSFNGGGQLFRPTGVAVAPDGGLVVRDYDPSFGTPRVWRFDSQRRRMWERSMFNRDVDYTYPLQGAAVLDNGSVVLTDPKAPEASLVMVGLAGDLHTLALRGRDPRQFDTPWGVALDRHFIVAADPGNERVIIYNHFDRPLYIVGGGDDPAVRRPAGVTVKRTGPAFHDALIYVADPGTSSVVLLQPDGSFVGRWGRGHGSDPDQFKRPEDVALADDGEVFIADTHNHRVVRRGPDGEVINLIGASPGVLEYPVSVAVGPLDLVYVLEDRKNRLQAFHKTGELAFDWDHQGSGAESAPGEFWLPVAVEADAKHVYVLENNGRDHVRIQVFTVEKEYPDNVLTIFANRPGADPGALWDPKELTVSPDGMILVADSGNNRLALFAWPGADVPPTPTPEPTFTASPTFDPPTETPAPTEEPGEPGEPSETPFVPTSTASPTPLPSASPTATRTPPRPLHLPQLLNRR